MRPILLGWLMLLLAWPALAQQSFDVHRLAPGVFAALVRPGSDASSNAFFVETGDFVLAAGGHLTRKVMADLAAAVAETSAKPLRYLVLTHHHRGFAYTDFDYPAGVQVLASVETWQGLDAEVREVAFPLIFFGEGLTLKAGGRTVILTNLASGHAAGNSIIFLPKEKLLFASDLLYVDSVGYLGEADLENWILALDFMEALQPEQVVPGFGPVASARQLRTFRTFLQDFATEVLAHIERGDTLKQTQASFSLPAYQGLKGYGQFLQVNLEHAYRSLKEKLEE